MFPVVERYGVLTFNGRESIVAEAHEFCKFRSSIVLPFLSLFILSIFFSLFRLLLSLFLLPLTLFCLSPTLFGLQKEFFCNRVCCCWPTGCQKEEAIGMPRDAHPGATGAQSCWLIS